MNIDDNIAYKAQFNTPYEVDANDVEGTDIDELYGIGIGIDVSSQLFTSDIFGEEKVELTHDEQIIKCESCHKIFATKSSLKRHEQRFPLCVQWKQVQATAKSQTDTNPPHIIDFLNEIKQSIFYTESQSQSKSESNVLECKYCKKPYSTSGNLYKHYKTSIVCNQMAFSALKAFVLTRVHNR